MDTNNIPFSEVFFINKICPVVYLIKSVMCKLILTKNKFRTLNVDEIEVILPSPLTEEIFWKKIKNCTDQIV
jgi:hypothetical protein